LQRRKGARSPGELEITRSTSEVAFCRSRASFSSRLSRATSACSPTAGSVLRVACFDALRCLSFDAFGRRDFMRWPLTLERLFMGSPVGSRIVAGLVGTLKIGRWPLDGPYPPIILMSGTAVLVLAMLSRSPNVEKPERDNARDEEHPSLEMNVKHRKIGDQPLPHCCPPQIRQDSANNGAARMILFGRICRPG
jgi:hypothetical protein